MRFLKRLLIGLVLLIATFLVVVWLQPDDYRLGIGQMRHDSLSLRRYIPARARQISDAKRTVAGDFPLPRPIIAGTGLAA
jgi:hypothetical protein